MADDVTRDLRGSGPAQDGAGAGATATAAPTAPPTPRSNPHAATVTDSGEGQPALAATLAQAREAPDLVGKSLDRYRVLSRLGAGGMGVVYAALDPALDRKVALKVLPPLAEDREAHLETRLRREAQALARLDHPNVVRVYDVGVAAHSVFVAMQLVEGATLAEKLEHDKPPAKEILALFAMAAHGLAAAHEAGIVHRDVKPSNILVDTAGRAYVSDFGLARGAAEALDDAREPTTTSENLLDESMTREGSVLGTPLFMSPEQHQGKAATPRSDQFSFCVSLWQALFDVHPFVRGRWNLAAAVDAMARDAVRDPPARVVPARIVRALRRGMRHDPDARWPTMRALAAELSPRSKTPWIAVGLALAGIAGGVGGSLALGGGGGDTCANAGAALSTVWGGSTAAQLKDAFARTKLAYAGSLADQVSAKLDAYGRDWSAMRVDACRTNLRGEQSDRLLDRRMRCLDHRLAEMGEVVQILTHDPAPGVVDRSLALADDLSSLHACEDRALEELVETPASPQRRAQRAGLDVRIVQLRAQMDAGVAKDELAAADALVASARELDDPVLLAHALNVAGDARYDADDIAQAMPLWREAANAAARGHDDEAATTAMHEIASALDDDGKPDQALVAIDDAAVFASRGTMPASLAADLEVVRASALDELNRFDESDQAYAHALELEQKAHGADSWEAAESMVDRTKLLNDVNRYDEARALLERAVPILQRTLGKGHPVVAIALQNLANSYMFLGRNDDARWAAEGALAIKRARFPPGAATIAFTLTTLGDIELGVGNLDAAERAFQEAIDIRTKALGPDNPDTLSSVYNLGIVRREQARYDDARAIFDRVLTARLAKYGEDNIAVANVIDALANVDLATGKRDRALDERKRALAIREKMLGPDAGDVAESVLGLAEMAADGGRCAEALAGVARVRAIQDRNHGSWWDHIEPLGVAAKCTDAPAALAALRAELEPIVTLALAGTDPQRKADAQLALGTVIWKQGDPARGRAMIERARQIDLDAKLPDAVKSIDEWLAAHPR